MSRPRPATAVNAPRPTRRAALATEGTADVIVVGGGIVGCAAAYFLARQGARVTLVERDSLGSHASGFALGGLTPFPGHNKPPEYLAWTREAFRLHATLAEELKNETGVATSFQQRDGLWIALSPQDRDDLCGIISHYRQLGFAVDWLEPQEATAREPLLSPALLGAMVSPETAVVEPYRLVLAVAQAAEKRGVQVRHGEVAGLERQGGRVTGVTLRHGTLSAPRVVLALGPWSEEANGWLGSPIPVGPLKGQILRLRLPGKPLTCYVSWHASYAATKEDGLVWAGSTEEEVGYDEQPTVAARNAILHDLVQMAPALAEAQLVRQTACLRPLSADGLPVLGPVPGIEGLVVATGGGRRGILLGPLLGRVAAELVQGRTPSMPLGPFLPARFAHGVQPTPRSAWEWNA
ncbi:MAG: FAD-dependent oxidoreductase [Chloroflexi bacterium]|nr:FAD-dependent oxidoreductase [Chloroflexota bacterium]